MTPIPVLRSLTVSCLIDPGYPVVTANIKYRVSDSETEITFPTGDKRTFKNWDVRGVRETFYSEECQKEHCVVEGAKTTSVSLVEWGIRPADVSRFVEKLAQNPRYEPLFGEIYFDETTLPPVPEPPKLVKAPIVAIEPPKTPKSEKTRGMRKFPYVEVARMWGEGLTQREIAAAIGRLDDRKDCTHTLRTFLTKMFKGYPDEQGNIVQLPYRSKSKKAAAGA